MKSHGKLFLFTFLTVLILFSCQTSEDNISDLPDFVLNPPVTDNSLYGVGYAKMSKLSLAKTVAATNARADIARQIETVVQASVTDYTQEAGVGDSTQVISYVESITREITDQKLNGARPVRYEQDVDGGLWVLMELPVSEVRTAVSDSFSRRNDAVFAEVQAQDALKRLDYQLQNNPPVSDPVK